MLRILLCIPRLNKQLMNCSVRYILLRISGLNKQLMEMLCITMLNPCILLCIPTLNKQLMKCFVFYYVYQG